MEEFIGLLQNPAHWGFELVNDFIFGLVLYPWIRQILEHLDKHK